MDPATLLTTYERWCETRQQNVQASPAGDDYETVCRNQRLLREEVIRRMSVPALTFKLQIEEKANNGDVGDRCVNRIVTWPVLPSKGDTIWIDGESSPVTDVDHYFVSDGNDPPIITVLARLDTDFFEGYYNGEKPGWTKGWD
jgi:hypothetical protein